MGLEASRCSGPLLPLLILIKSGPRLAPLPSRFTDLQARVPLCLREMWDGRAKMNQEQMSLYRQLHSKGAGGAEPGAAYQLFNEGAKQMPSGMLQHLIFRTLYAPRAAE